MIMTGSQEVVGSSPIFSKALSYGAHIMTRDNIEWLIQELCETSVLLSE